MEQLLCHLFGDYITGQSDWMALNKNKRSIPCLVHVFLYTLTFLFLTTSWKALLVIGVTHFLIDRFSLARYLIWVKNHINPHFEYAPWKWSKNTGYYDITDKQLEQPTGGDREAFEVETGITTRPMWITVWLYIISDNTLHLLCNWLALKYLA